MITPNAHMSVMKVSFPSKPSGARYAGVPWQAKSHTADGETKAGSKPQGRSWVAFVRETRKQSTTTKATLVM
eukprot:3223157-Amphidinium_carterae.1